MSQTLEQQKGSSMQLIVSDHAAAHTCCTADRQCKGDRCMAWIEHTYTNRPNVRPPVLHPDRKNWTPPEVLKSGKGYCGMVNPP